MINGLQNVRVTTNELRVNLVPRQNKPNGDAWGFNPTINQAEYNTPQVSPYGFAIVATPPMGAIDYFPSYPFRGIRNYVGAQRYGHPISEMLYSRFRGYRGILPINQLPLINKPLPYQIPAYEQFGEAYNG